MHGGFQNVTTGMTQYFGRVVQCKSRPCRGSSTCFQHRSVRGVSRARFGLLDENVPTAALEEFQSLQTDQVVCKRRK